MIKELCDKFNMEIPPVSSFDVYLSKENERSLSRLGGIRTFLGAIVTMMEYVGYGQSYASETAKKLFSANMPSFIHGCCVERYAALSVLGDIYRHRKIFELDREIEENSFMLARHFDHDLEKGIFEKSGTTPAMALVGSYIARQFYDAVSKLEQSCFSHEITNVNPKLGQHHMVLSPMHNVAIVKAAWFKCHLLASSP